MEEVKQNEILSKSDAGEVEKSQHDIVDENNVSNGNHTETSLSQSSSRTSFFPGPIFSQIRDGVHSAFSGKSFHLPHWWDSGASRFVKIKRNGVTYAVLLGKTLDDMPYCFRVRRDENEKKAFFTPMAIYASTTTSSSTSTSSSSTCAVEVRSPECDIKVVELETLPDIVTYERGKFRAALQEIFEEAEELYTSERLEELVKHHAEEGMEFLVAFRALHPPVHLLQIIMKKEEEEGTTAAVIDCSDGENLRSPAEVVEPPMEDKLILTKEEENEKEEVIEEEKEENVNVDAYRSVLETSHLMTLEKENDSIRNENERLHEEMKSLKTEKNEFLRCIESLQTEVMGLTECMNYIGKMCRDEMDSLRDETQVECTESTEIKSSTPVAIEECVKAVFSLYNQKVTQLQEQQDRLQNEVNQIRNTLRVSQEHSEKLLSVLDLRERQLSTVLEESQLKDSHFCSGCQWKLGNTKQNGNLNTKSLPRGVSAVEKDDGNDNDDDEELHAWMSTHNRQNTKRSVIDRGIKKDNEIESPEENNPTSQTSPIENITFSVLRMGHSDKNKKYHHFSDMEPQQRLTYLHSCGNTFKHSPWRRAPYSVLGYTNETLYHQHTPDRGVGLTTMPPKTWRRIKKRQFNKNSSRQTHVPSQRSQHQSTQLLQEEKRELEMLAQPPDV